MAPNDRKKIKKSLTCKLNNLRTHYGFITTDDQKAAYRDKYKRKSKRLQNIGAEELSTENYAEEDQNQENEDQMEEAEEQFVIPWWEKILS